MGYDDKVLVSSIINLAVKSYLKIAIAQDLAEEVVPVVAEEAAVAGNADLDQDYTDKFT